MTFEGKTAIVTGSARGIGEAYAIALAKKGASVVVSHLTERFGTFFIIVLGEAVVAAVAGVAGLEFTLQSWLVTELNML